MLRPPAPSPAAASTPSKLKLATRSQPISGAHSAQKSGMRCVVARTSTAGGSPSTTSAAGRRFPTGRRRSSTPPSTLMNAASRRAERRKNVCTAADPAQRCSSTGRSDSIPCSSRIKRSCWAGSVTRRRRERVAPPKFSIKCSIASLTKWSTNASRESAGR